jgi:hypothetical protein
MPSRSNNASRFHGGYGFVQRRARIFTGAHLEPGQSVVAAHAYFEPPRHDPGHLQTQDLSTQDAVFDNWLGAMFSQQINQVQV